MNPGQAPSQETQISAQNTYHMVKEPMFVAFCDADCAAPALCFAFLKLILN